MGTILPEESKTFQEKVNAGNGNYFEAPVLGSIPQAKDGKLIVMVGGTQDHLKKWQNLLKCLGQDIHFIGEVGKAAALKLALNQLIASLTAAFSLSLGIIKRNNIDVDLLMKIVRNSALYAPTFDKKLPRMLKRDFSNPNFPTKHLLKDADLILSESKRLGLSTNALEGVIDIIKLSLEKGFIETDYSSIYNAVNPQD
jgi:3-hydroxyisobutyrate dehydrogenase